MVEFYQHIISGTSVVVGAALPLRHSGLGRTPTGRLMSIFEADGCIYLPLWGRDGTDIKPMDRGFKAMRNTHWRIDMQEASFLSKVPSLSALYLSLPLSLPLSRLPLSPLVSGKDQASDFLGLRGYK